MKLTIAHLYPDLLNLYGDRGNIQSLVKRLEWRDYEACVLPICIGDNIDFSKIDIVLLGGGTDLHQELVCNYLQEVKEEFKNFVESDGVVLALCGGYQMLGEYYYNNNKKIEGLGILDITTTWKPKRFIRNIIINSPLFKTPVVGFENHSGRTHIGKNTPFGKVFFGVGNNGRSGFEGVIYKNLIGTYLHGPLLPKNPHVCDYLLERALRRKYNVEIKLEPLDDKIELLANKVIVNRYSDKKDVLKETIKRYT
jgi:CobQ-like glutamine amidotransferase family enzyme